jgi:hypothetical protein
MKKVLLPLAMLSLSMSSAALAVEGNDGHHHNNKQTVYIINCNQKSVLVTVLDKKSCQKVNQTKVKGGKTGWITVCNTSSYQVDVCFTGGHSPHDNLEGGKYSCSSEVSHCYDSPDKVIVKGTGFDSLQGGWAPQLICVSKHHDHDQS